MRFEYAVHRTSGQVMHVDDVPNGKKCERICKNCGDHLLAKNKGKIIGHHFSHTTKEESHNCRMTQLHMAMQVYFSTRAEITLPGNKCAVSGIDILVPARNTSFLKAGMERRVGPYSADKLPGVVYSTFFWPRGTIQCHSRVSAAFGGVSNPEHPNHL